jgi:iron complex outermembrane recepter protein
LGVSLSAGSFGQWSGRATLGGTSGALDGLITAQTVQRDGYRDHSQEDRKDVFANAGWQASEDVSTRIYASFTDFYAELPRELTPAQYAQNPRQARLDAIAGNHSKKVEAWRLAFKTTATRIAGGTLELGASHEQQTLFHPIVSSPFFSLLIDTDHKDSGAMVRYHRTAGDHNFVFGGNYGYSTAKGGNYQNVGGQPGFLMWTTDSTASSLELFALDRWSFAPQWTLVYGTQFLSADRNVDGFKASYDSFNPRVGVIRALSAQSEWFASASRTYEAPTTFELTDDANGGATPLAAMHGRVFETGLRGTSMREATRFNWEVAAYYTGLRNEILSIDSPTAPGTSLSKNIDKTTHAGIEALLGASFAMGDGSHRLDPLLNLTYNAFKFDSDPNYDSNRLPAAPRYFVRGEILYRNVAGFFAGPTFDLIGKRYVDFANTYSVKSYGLIGARAGYNADKWEVFAEGRNLTDRKYVATVVVKDRADAGMELLYPGSPRSVYVGARFRY